MYGIKAPFLRYEDINRIATELLEHYGRLDSMPVDIEALVEFDLGLEVIPQRGFQEQIGVVGYLSMDMETIIVDEHVLERIPTRYRFTLAHELGHRVLHMESFKAVEVASVEEWREFYGCLEDEDHGWFERQAYWFAGAILVPEYALIQEYDAAVGKLSMAGLDGAELSGPGQASIAGAIAKRFDVSTAVVKRRLTETSIW